MVFSEWHAALHGCGHDGSAPLHPDASRCYAQLAGAAEVLSALTRSLSPTPECSALLVQLLRCASGTRGDPVTPHNKDQLTTSTEKSMELHMCT